MDKMPKLPGEAFGVALLIVPFMAFVGLLCAVPTYFIWNWIVPDLFGLNSITFWQAWGICFMFDCWFKGSLHIQV